jgi:hypothetical protein
VAALAILATPAGAAMVQQTATGSVHYFGQPGEANRLTLSRAGDELLFADAVPITAQPPCSSIAGVARCPVAGDSITAFLGDADDTVTVSGATVPTVVLFGDLGVDTLTGGDEDTFINGGPGSDTLEGGGGSDELSYSGQEGGVIVDLAAGTGGVPGEDDVVSGFERVRGSAVDDTLLGSDAGETLIGESGADTIDGRGGDDELRGDPGSDRLRGGSGDDELVGGVGRNRLRGGRGHDVLYGDDRRDRLFGGRGRDRLDAEDGRRDRVNCGPGLDRARTDAEDRRRSCELGWQP